MLSLTVYTICVEKKLLLSFCPLGACHKVRKAVVIGKWHQNFWMKCFQRKPHNKNLENIVKNPMTSCFWCTNDVCSRFRGNGQTDRHTYIDKTTTVILWRMHQGLIIVPKISICSLLALFPDFPSLFCFIQSSQTWKIMKTGGRA